MCFCVEDKLIQTDKIRLAENQVKVPESLRRPETFHAIIFWCRRICHISECRICKLSLGVLGYVGEHLPSLLLQYRIAGDAVEKEDTLNSFWSEDVSSVRYGYEARRQTFSFNDVGCVRS
jgi:hypothetical protein